jgi:hypothetical protein
MFGFDKKRKIYLQHATAETMREICGNDVFSAYYKFSVVRNPFERTVSVYHYLKKHHDIEFGSFENYVHQLPELLRQESIQNGSHHLPQLRYTHIDGQCICDYIARFESLPHSLNPVRKAVSIDKPLEKHNYDPSKAWKKRSASEYYTENMIEVMLDVYAEDFALLGYSQIPETRA